MRKLRDGATIDGAIFRYGGDFWLLDYNCSLPLKKKVQKRLDEDKSYMERCRDIYNSTEAYINLLLKRNSLLQEWLDKGK